MAAFPWGRRSLTVAYTVFALAGAAFSESYSLKLMPIPTGVSGSYGTGVNESGLVSVHATAGGNAAYSWQIGSSATQLPSPSGQAFALDVNEGGQIAGLYGGWQAIIWDSPSAYTSYGVLPGYAQGGLIWGR